MTSRNAYTASEALDKMLKLKQEGKTEKEVAIEFGFEKNGKADISSFREYLREQKELDRDTKAAQIHAMINAGYSITEAAKLLQISEVSARSLSLYYSLHEGENK